MEKSKNILFFLTLCWRPNLWHSLTTGCCNELDSCFIVFCALPEGISTCLTFARHWMFEDCVCVWTGVGPTNVFSTWLWWGWREESSSSSDWRQTAAPSVLSLHLFGLLCLLHSVHHLCHLLSNLSCSLGTRPVRPDPSLWQSLRVGATV